MKEDVKAALCFALWHHQGAGSRIGQPIRKMLNIVGQSERLSAYQYLKAWRIENALAQQEQEQEHNFCQRCGKRTNDIHTCTPPASQRKPSHKEFMEWAGKEGYDTAYTINSNNGKFIPFNPMTAELWKAWQAAHDIKENT